MSRRASQTPKTNQPRRRLNSFRRQLVAAFSSERQARLCASIESGASVATNVQRDSKCGSFEGELQHATKIPTNKSYVFKSGWTTSRARHLNSSPKHLIRMFAERHDDSSNETSAGDQQQHRLGVNTKLMSLIADTPSRAANCSKIERLAKAHSSDVNHVARNLWPSNERPPQVEGKFAARAFNLPVQSPNSNQTPPPPFCRSDNPVSRTASKAAAAASTKMVLKKRAPLSSEASRLVDLLASYEWRSDSEQAVKVARNSMLQFKLRLTSIQAKGFALTPDEPLRLQQEALCELIDTELHYIDRLELIVDLFLNTLEYVQARLGLLADISKHQLASNVEQILEANLRLWKKHLNSEPSSPTELFALTPHTFADAFANIHHIFKPYYRFCIEQSSCTRFVRKTALSNDPFRIYLAWCEAQPECERMKLTDLLACPMQRLTRYSLLLRTISKQTPREQLDQHECLLNMSTLTDKFVKSVDLELRRRDEFLRLLRASNRLDLNQLGQDFGADSNQQRQIVELLSRHYRHLDLMAPVFDCPSACLRHLIFDSSVSKFDGKAWTAPLDRLKFKDNQTANNLDVVLLIFTDQLVVCKQQKLQRCQDQCIEQTSSGSMLRRQSSNYLASFKRHSMRLSRRRPVGHKTNSNSNLTGDSFEKSYPPPATLRESYKSRHLESNLSSEAEPESKNPADTTPTSNINNLSWPIRRRAASHSYLLGTNLLTPAASGRGSSESCGQPDDSSLLSPLRAILRVPSERALNNEVRAGRLHRHQSRSSQQISAAVFSQHYRGSSSYENSSNCSLISGHNNAPIMHNRETFEESADVQPMSMRDYDLSAQSDTESLASMHKRAKGERRQLQMPRLLAIRPPYAIERLALHELADGQSVLFCQLNETRTIVNSFVVYCHAQRKRGDKLSPSQSASSGTQNHCGRLEQQNAAKSSVQTKRANPSDTSKHETNANYHDHAASLSQARRLILLVKEAQVRQRALAKLHGREITTSANVEPSRSCSLYQNSLSLEVPSSPKHLLGYKHFRSNDSEVDDNSTSDEQGWRLRLFAEQHQLFLLNHGLQHELVTHEFTYNERSPNDFVVVAKPIGIHSNKSTSSSCKTVTSSTLRQSNQRPQLSRSGRFDCPSKVPRYPMSVFDSTKKSLRPGQSLLSQRDLSKDKSKSNGCLDYVAAANSDQPNSKESPTRPPSLAANLSLSQLTSNDSNPPSPCRSSRRNLNSLRRQNVILSASCEHNQLLQTAHEERESASALLLRTSGLESSSIDSAGLISTTDDSFDRYALRSTRQLMMGKHESSSIQTTFDQTFDEDERSAGMAKHHFELSPIKSVQSMLLCHQASASSEQTSSPIAVTLTVPGLAGKQHQQLNSKSVQTESDMNVVGSIDEESEDTRQTGCLDLNKTFCLMSGHSGDSDGSRNKRQDSKRSSKLSPRVTHRSRSPAARLQDMIQCLRPNR